MFLLVASALAGSTALGWPCQRLNWGWRNVWSTCSIHSFVPGPAGTVEPPNFNSGFRYSTSTQPPVGALNLGGWYQPAGSGSGAPPLAIPQYFCNSAAATGTGATASLRNRCRRAVDAYGALVRSCSSSLGGNRGPVQNAAFLGPDFAPAAGHQPHVSNVLALTHASGFCSAPNPNVAQTPAQLATPSNTCPGLLGWFTVVYNACGLTTTPVLSPLGQSSAPNAPFIYNYFPVGNTVGPQIFTSAVPWSVGILCSNAAVSATNWNPVGTTFRTSRCRKALDQFGRTAQRCHGGFVAPGPAQSNGFSDPLRIFAVGNVAAGAPLSPLGLNVLAPMCN